VPPRALRPTGLVLVDKPPGPSSFAIVKRLRELGYLYVAVDLAGFQSGSANLLLKRPPRASGG